MKILVTGALGWTAKTIVEALKAENHDVSALDLAHTKQHIDKQIFTKIHYGTVSHFDFVQSAMQDNDIVVHLAVATHGGYDTPQIPFDVNVRGTANIFESARQQDLNRVILISSAPFHVEHKGKIHAITDRLQGQDGDFMYDMTKCLQEDIAHYYARTCGIQTITLRAGHIVDGRTEKDPKERSLETIEYGRGAWVCRYDLADAVIRSLDYPVADYNAFHIIGAKEAHEKFDMERTETIFGFTPKSQFEQYPPTKKGEA